MSALLEKTKFTELLIRENAPAYLGFAAWVFCPGMLFRASKKWWGKQEERDNSHEGLDLCLYRDRRNRIQCLNEKTRIPVTYDGTLIKMVKDFLGRTVIIEHRFRDLHERRFYTIYGHIKPCREFRVGDPVKEGDIIGCLAGTGRSMSGILPHLHISLGWTPRSISYKNFDWTTIGSPEFLSLLDPLSVIDGSYVLQENAFQGCLGLATD